MAIHTDEEFKTYRRYIAQAFVDRAKTQNMRGKKRDAAALEFFCGVATADERFCGIAFLVCVRGYNEVEELAKEPV